MLAKRPNKYAPTGIEYVTWMCVDGDNYFWGHYLTSRDAAEHDLVDRAKDQLQLLDQIRGRSSPVNEVERDR